jgi:putative PEP-CTERM system histidine kinase
MMPFHYFFSFASALLCGALASVVVFRNRRSYVHGVFAIGMIALALEQTFIGMSLRAALPFEVLDWQRLRFIATAFLPGIWIVFSLIYGRANYKEFAASWKWVIFVAFVLPLVLVTFFSSSLLVSDPEPDVVSIHVVRLGLSGYLFYLIFVLGNVLILMNLERTLKASAGSMRWRIKFMVLGLGGFFALRIYTSSQTLLFSAVDLGLYSVVAGALIIANILMFVAVARAWLLNVEIYLSPTLLYNSFTILAVGIYLLAIGIAAKVVTYLGGGSTLPLNAFLVFLALLALTIFFLSDELRQHVKRLLYRHFQRPRYDYRKEWMTFAQRTTSLVDIGPLCNAVAKMVAETFAVSSVTIWLLDEAQGKLTLAGSTAFSEGQVQDLRLAEKGALALIPAIRGQQMAVDFDPAANDWAGEISRANRDYFEKARIWYCIPLLVGPEALGLMTLNERVTEGPFSVEDFDLLKTIADQSAGAILNLKLSERLLLTKEMEAFQTFSAFFVHDLKNLASTLSLTIQNLPAQFDNPAFRKDALLTMSQSIAKIDALCGRLSLLSKKPELELVEADLNDVISATLASLNGTVRAALVQAPQPLPKLMVDPEQVRKVLLNLVLNASEAVGEGGEIRVTTERRNGWAVLSVNDNGRGMSREFIAHSLFQPFRTTKKQGIGIGLFQTKKIVEAHKGKIEVESEEGRGTTFRVLLPVKAAGERVL